MNDNRSNVIRLRSLVVHLSDTLADIASDDESIPDEFRFSLAILDEYVALNRLPFVLLNFQKLFAAYAERTRCDLFRGEVSAIHSCIKATRISSSA